MPKRDELLKQINFFVRQRSTTMDSDDAESLLRIIETHLSPTWDPEGPEVLWEAKHDAGLRLLGDGTWQLRTMGRWTPWNTLPYLQQVADELARRLLEERKQQEALDEHNDKTEEAAYRATGEISGATEDWLLDRAQVAMHYSEWKRLVALDELWGDDGELRKRLADFNEPGHGHPWFSQLRSELLAMPWKEER